MKALYVISGVTGMTGNELARQLVIDEDNLVIGFDNFFASSIHTIEDLLNKGNFIFREYDLNDKGDMDELEKMVCDYRPKFEKVIYVNCAAVVHTEHFYYVNRTFLTNVVGMKEFLEQAMEIKADVFINCSTSEVYSMRSWVEGGVRECDYLVMASAENSQRTSYAMGKLMTEFFIRDAVNEGKIKGCSLRFANVYSKNELYPKHIIPHIINSLRRDGRVVLLENSKNNKRSFLHNYDSCTAIIALINEEEALDGSAYNVASEEEISIMDLVELCAKKMGIRSPKIIFEGYRKNDPERRGLNTEKIRSRTNWRPVIMLENGIEMCLEELNN